MLVLAVDTSSPAGGLAVLQNNRTTGTVSAWTSELYSSRMFRQLEFLLRELSLEMDDFELFAVATGPGSFTGLRVGLTAVKGWAEVYGKPIATVTTLEAVAVQSHSTNKKIVPVLDARRGQVYFAMYERGFDHGRDLTLLRGEQVGTAEEFVAQLDLQGNDEPPIVITPVPELLADLLSRSETKTNGSAAGQPQLRIEEASPALAPYIGCLGLVHARQGRLTDPLQVDANYIRRSDAELHWKVRTGI